MARLTIGTTPVPLTSTERDWSTREPSYLYVRVLTPDVTLFVGDKGDAAVTPETGWPVQPGEILTLTVQNQERIYGVVEAGTAEVAVLRTGI